MIGWELQSASLNLFIRLYIVLSSMKVGSQIRESVTRYIPLVVVGFLGLTATYFVSAIGPMILAIIWVILIVVAMLAYLPRLRVPSRSEKEPDNQLEKEPFHVPPWKRQAILRSFNHSASVTLDTELHPFDWFSEELKDGDEIRVDAESEDGELFHFFVCDEYQFNINRRRSVNFEYYEGKEFTSRFKKHIVIPHTDTWYFIAYTPEGHYFTAVRLEISRAR